MWGSAEVTCQLTRRLLFPPRLPELSPGSGVNGLDHTCIRLVLFTRHHGIEFYASID